MVGLGTIAAVYKCGGIAMCANLGNRQNPTCTLYGFDSGVRVFLRLGVVTIVNSL